MISAERRHQPDDGLIWAWIVVWVVLVVIAAANLYHADLTGADLSDADMRGCKGLTQEQIDQAVVQEGWPPNLEGAVDANTGEPLVWHGRTP